MAIKLTRLLAATLVAMLLAPTVGAQDLSRSSQTPSADRDAALGANIDDAVKEFAEGEPEMRQVDRATELRDTGTRGSFVGADSDDATFIRSESPGGDSGGSRRTQGPTARGTFRQRGQQSQSGRSRGTTLRPRLALGFHYTPNLSPQFAKNTQAHLKRMPGLSKNSSIRVSVEKNVVVLEGIVANAHDRALSAQLVALTPGVHKIDNRLEVAGTDSPSPEISK
jgi:hypothetical protein